METQLISECRLSMTTFARGMGLYEMIRYGHYVLLVVMIMTNFTEGTQNVIKAAQHNLENHEVI